MISKPTILSACLVFFGGPFYAIGQIEEFEDILDDPVLVADAMSTIEQRIAGQLNQPIQPIEFENTLRDFAKLISSTHRINVLIDETALKNDGLTAEDIEISAQLSGISLRSALRIILDPHELAWTIKNDALVLTTQFAEEEYELRTRIYKIHDVLDANAVDSSRRELKQLVSKQTDGLWEEFDNTGGRLNLYEDKLVVAQSERVHGEIEDLISMLRKADGLIPPRREVTDPATRRPTNMPLFLSFDPAAQAWDAKLEQLTTPIKVSSIAELTEYLSANYEINCLIDQASFDEQGLDPSSVKLQGDLPFPMRLGKALHNILEPHELKASFHNGCLYISAIVSCESYHTRIHPVGDLIDSSRHTESLQELIGLLLKQTDGLWIDIDYDGGSIALFGNNLIIRQTERVHQEITSLARGIRRIKGLPQKDLISHPAIGDSIRKPSEISVQYRMMDLEDRLEQTVEQLNVSSLPELAKHLSATHKINCVIDKRALDDEGLKANDIELKGDLKGISLHSALNTILEPHDLTFTVKNEVLCLTTLIGEEETMSTRIYPVVDLLDTKHKTQSLNLLREIIQTQSDGLWLEIDGDGGTISSFKTPFVIRTTSRVHSEIVDMLNVLRYIHELDPTATTIDPNMKLPDMQKANRVVPKIDAGGGLGGGGMGGGGLGGFGGGGLF